MKKAKSRLSLKQSTVSTTRIIRRKLEKNSWLKNLIKQTIVAHLKHLPILILGLVFYLLVWQIMHQIYPAQIKDWLINDAYLPLLVPSFVANFLFFSFLLLSSRRGLLISLYLNCLLSLQLQQVKLNVQLVVLLLIFFVIMEIILIALTKNKKVDPHAKLKQKTSSGS